MFDLFCKYGGGWVVDSGPAKRTNSVRLKQNSVDGFAIHAFYCTISSHGISLLLLSMAAFKYMLKAANVPPLSAVWR
jgi:hypothetical protein